MNCDKKRPCMFIVGSLLVCAIAASAQPATTEPYTFLKKYLAFTDAELAGLETGKVIAKSPKTKDPREVATFGAMRLNVPKEIFVEKFRNIVAFKQSANVLEIGKFSATPRLEDLKGLTLSDDDFNALRQCQVGKCELRLPADVITRLQKEVKWETPKARQQVDALLRQTLIDYVKAYLQGGNAALSEYHDREAPLRLADEFKALLDQSPYLYEYAPEFHQYLAEYPKASLPDVENFLYWSKEKFGLKPVVSLTHVTIYKRTRGAVSSVLIATKQIYANHYYDASLGLTAFVDVPAASAAYLMYLNRTRIDALRGWLARANRSMIENGLLSGMEKNLRVIKRKLEPAETAARP